MKKQNEFAALSATEANEKRNEKVKELVRFRVSMDPTVISSSTGPAALMRDLKLLNRKCASMVPGIK